jgi:hypothetical protein
MVIKNRPFRRQGVGKQGDDVGRRGEAMVLEASQRLSFLEQLVRGSKAPRQPFKLVARHLWMGGRVRFM